jgi:arabinogalactan oligomer/maltooligosaccharide transport system permease protein
MATSFARSRSGATITSPAIAHAPEGRSRFRKWLVQVGWRHFIGLIAAAFALFPLLYVLQSALNPVGTVGSSTNGWLSFIPTHASTHNFTALFHSPIYPFWDWVVNSLVICTVSTFLSLFISFAAAYAFSRMRFAGRRAGLLAVLLISIFPSFISVIALYRMSAAAGNVFPLLSPGRVSLALVYLGGSMGVNTWLTKSYIDTIPVDLDEAAMIDGASHAQIFFGLILRLAAPILVVTGLLAFIGVLNEYIFANLFLTSGSAKTLIVGLFGLFNGGEAKNYGMFAAGALIAAVPVVVLFLIFQRYLVGGLLRGSVKY